MKIHIAIVSEQILANLIPALMDRPDRVYLVTSRQMAERGLDRRLAQLLRREVIAVEVRGEAPDVGLTQIHDYALQLVTDIQSTYPEAAIVLNATGGTKLMALGFVEILRGDAQQILYTDTAHRRIELLLSRTNQTPSTKPMENVLDVPRYLAAQGFRYQTSVSDDPSWRERAAGRKAASKYLGRRAANIPDFIGAINALADRALAGGEELVEPRQSFNNVPWGDWAATLRELTRAGLIRWVDGESEIEFLNAESARFLHGGWLEEYTWHIVKDEGSFDTRLGVAGNWENAPNSRNEFDVLACHGNQLLFIECKTLRHHEENDNQLAYKVDSLGRDARGLFGATWLLTAREPSAVLIERAGQSRIRLIGPTELPRLREAIRGWVQPG